MDALHGKKKALEEYLRGLGSLAVAYSAGVDSTFLLAAAHGVLGDRVLAVPARRSGRKQTYRARRFPVSAFPSGSHRPFFCLPPNSVLNMSSHNLLCISYGPARLSRSDGYSSVFL